MSAVEQATTGRKTRQGGKTWARLSRFLLPANAAAMYVFLYAPILLLVVFSFNASRFVSVWRGFTLEWYARLLADRAIVRALTNSLIVAVASTAISTVCGTLLALAMERYHFLGKTAFDALLYLPIIIPEISMAVMLLLFFVQASIPLGLATIIISHVAFNISYVTVVVRARLAGCSVTLEEAAQDLGANGWQTFRRITLPLLMPGIVAGALLAFTLSLDDYVITFFTAGGGSTTLPLHVYGMVKTGITPKVNALSTVMLVASMTLVVLSLLMQRGGQRE
ncbi:MAG: ABC transporter permease [Chloroflexia bacterium]